MEEITIKVRKIENGYLLIMSRTPLEEADERFFKGVGNVGPTIKKFITEFFFPPKKKESHFKRREQ